MEHREEQQKGIGYHSDDVRACSEIERHGYTDVVRRVDRVLDDNVTQHGR
jgi:hypothetical protein